MPVLPNGACCLRCGRPVPNEESDALLEWKAVDNDVVCPDCQAPEEERAVGEGMALTAEEEAGVDPRES